MPFEYNKLTIPKNYALLTESVNRDSKMIHTTHGSFRIRKNGRFMIALDSSKKREFVRVTPNI